MGPRSVCEHLEDVFITLYSSPTGLSTKCNTITTALHSNGMNTNGLWIMRLCRQIPFLLCLVTYCTRGYQSLKEMEVNQKTSQQALALQRRSICRGLIFSRTSCTYLIVDCRSLTHLEAFEENEQYVRCTRSPSRKYGHEKKLRDMSVSIVSLPQIVLSSNVSPVAPGSHSILDSAPIFCYRVQLVHFGRHGKGPTSLTGLVIGREGTSRNARLGCRGHTRTMPTWVVIVWLLGAKKKIVTILRVPNGAWLVFGRCSCQSDWASMTNRFFLLVALYGWLL